MAKYVGAEVAYEAFDDEISGVLWRSDDRAVIGVNQEHHVHRKRFTIAHELGHLVLHKGRPVIVEEDFLVNYRDQDSSHSIDRDEIEANAFAAALLMPADHVLARVRAMVEQDDEPDSEWTANDVRRLASVFRVSPQAMGLRLTNLGIRHPGC